MRQNIKPKTYDFWGTVVAIHVVVCVMRADKI